MRAIILAAGRGERMRPLTDTTPKPLLQLQGKPLIVWHIEALAAAGVRDLVINCAWLAEQFPATLGDGSRYGLRLHYSDEARAYGGALETAGGIASALPWLCADGDAAFWAVSGDIHAPDFRYDAEQARAFAAGDQLAHLWMVPTQAAHPVGDFAISAAGLALQASQAAPDGSEPLRVYGNIGLYRREFFAGVVPGRRLPMRPCLDAAISAGRVTAELYEGRWANVGTPAQLAELQGG